MTQPDLPDENADVDFSTVFAANIHEIKNQLFLLFNAIESASGESWAQGDDAQATLKRIKYGSSQMAQRLAHVLALYRIAQGRYELDIDYHDANELLQEIRLETHSLIDHHGIAISVAPNASDEALYGFFDREMVRGALVSAVHNALHYAKNRICLGVTLEDGYLCFRVEDDSPGYPAEILASQGARTKLDLGGGGTGLGLYFAATVATLHRNQGKVGFTRLSNGGAFGGAVFALYLP